MSSIPTDGAEGLAARRVAAAALQVVLAGRATLEAALAAAPDHAALDARDRAFALALSAVAIRRHGQTQAALDAFMNRPLPASAAAARAILHAGAAQILWLRTPPHAAVSTAVALAREAPAAERYAGLINAVLRRVAEKGAAIAAAAAPESNLPQWLRDSWRKAYGTQRLTKIAASLLAEPPLDLTVKNPAEAEHWAQALGAEILPTGTLRKPGIGDVAALPGYADGAWWAQDAGAALPARLLAVRPDERVLDLCAAPGGKTLQLAAAGADVTALDASAKRLKRLTENLVRTGLTAQVIAADGRSFRPEAPFDAILLDAPCTATGTLRRRPDAAWLKKPGDVAALAQIQDQLGAAAAEMLRLGGRMIICTCSMQPEEGEQWLSRLLAARDDLALDPVRAQELPELQAALTPENSVRLTPEIWADKGGIDGFFIARVVRRA
ncbi:MAG: RsmB/NOP family class I SAM-dependent RNA methyltransferase [Maricaulaceae bacterium]|nr:RsmB/NOP family class I SAM-dependent RNA methyltransferase [Maricaulaceae bacterium]